MAMNNRGRFLMSYCSLQEFWFGFRKFSWASCNSSIYIMKGIDFSVSNFYESSYRVTFLMYLLLWACIPCSSNTEVLVHSSPCPTFHEKFHKMGKEWFPNAWAPDLYQEIQECYFQSRYFFPLSQPSYVLFVIPNMYLYVISPLCESLPLSYYTGQFPFRRPPSTFVWKCGLWRIPQGLYYWRVILIFLFIGMVLSPRKSIPSLIT